VAALVNILVPAETLLGVSAAPGEAAGYGLLDADDARDLVAAAARHSDTRWCVTALHPDGTAAAHGCARGRTPRRPQAPPATRWTRTRHPETPVSLTRAACPARTHRPARTHHPEPGPGTTWPGCGSG